MARLSWPSSEPAPFESGWSILTKLRYWNGLKPYQLRDLIGSDTASKNTQLRSTRADWIDIKRLVELLRVDEARLREGFLSELGGPQLLGYRSLGIRHCPYCLAMGYHSAIFDVALLGVCPWHQQVLTEPCLKCLQYMGGASLRSPIATL